MNDSRKTKAQLIDEIKNLRKKLEEKAPKLHIDSLPSNHDRNNNYFYKLSEIITDTVWTADLDMNYSYISPSVERLRGYSSEEMMRIGIEKALPERSLIKLKEAISNLIENAKNNPKSTIEPQTLQLEARNKDGRIIWLEVRGSLILDDKGVPIGVMGISRDITERVDAERALKESEEKYRILVETASDGICILQENVVRYANPQLAHMLRCPLDELVNDNLGHYLSHAASDYARLLYMMHQGGERNMGIFETTLLRKDGSEVDVELNASIIQYNSSPASLVIIRDITERKWAEEALRESEERYRTLFKTSSDAIILIDKNEVMDCNSASMEMFGISSKQEFVGMHPADLSPATQPDGIDSFSAANRKMEFALNRGNNRFEWVHQKQNGENFFCHVTLTALRLRKKRIIQATIRDISDYKNVEKALKKAHEELEERVRQRTADLLRANRLLTQEIAERKRIENALRASEERFKQMSYRDKMSGLYNRTFFEEEMARLNENYDRYCPLGIICIDVDGLKVVNDTFGHRAGDDLLISLARLLSQPFQGGEIVARTGGDEFCVVLPGISEELLSNKQNEILSLVKNYNKRTPRIPLSISVGSAISEQVNVKDAFAVYQKADDNMYNYKLTQAESSKSRIIDIMLAAMAERDVFTEGHVKRISEMLEEVCDKLNFAEERKRNLLLLAKVHDLGNVGVPDEVLFKPGKLTEEEFQQIRQHVDIGYKIASRSKELSHIAYLVLHHHEFWNGEGYPSKLKGEEIPLECRVLAIVDAFDAMIHNRPYKDGIEKGEALEDLRKNAGSRFDPSLVDEIIEVIKEAK